MIRLGPRDAVGLLGLAAWLSMVLLLGGHGAMARVLGHALLGVAAGIAATQYFPVPQGWDRLTRGWGLIAAAGVLSLIPLPAAILGYVAPGTLSATEAWWWSAAVWPDLTIAALMQWTAPLCLALIVAVAARGRAGPSSAWVGALLCVGVLISVSALGHVWAGAAAFVGLLVPNDAPTQFFAPFPNPNHAAIALVALAPLSVWAIRAKRRRWLMYLAAAQLIGMGLVVVAARSVGSGVALVGMTSAWGAVRFLGPRRAPAAVAGLGAAGLSVVFLGVRLTDSGWEQRSWAVRIQQWTDTVSLYGDSPLLGVGLGNYGATYRAHSSLLGASAAHAHSDWLEFAVETGVVGVVLLVVAAWVCLPLIRLSGAQGAATLGLLGLGLHGLVDFPLHIPAILGLAGILVGLMLVADGPAHAPVIKPRVWQWLAGVQVAAAVIIGWQGAVGHQRDVVLSSVDPVALEEADGALAWLAPWHAVRDVSSLRMAAERADAAMVSELAHRIRGRASSDPDILRVAARITLAAGQTEHGEALLVRSIARAPGDYRGYGVRAASMARRTVDAAALAQARAAALVRWPAHWNAQPLELAYREYPIALYWLDVLEPADPWWLIQLGNTVLESDPEVAVLAYQGAQLGYSDARADIPSLALALARAGRIDEARAYAAELAARYPDRSNVQVRLGQVETLAGRLEAARDAFAQAWRVGGRGEWAARAVRLELGRSGVKSALTYAELLILSSPAEPHLLVVRAELIGRSGNAARCVELLKSVQRSESVPSYPDVLNKCTASCLHCGGAPE